VLSAADVVFSSVDESSNNSNQSINFALLRVPVDDESLNLPFIKSKPNNSYGTAPTQMTASQFAAAGPSAIRDRDKVYLSLSAANNNSNNDLHSIQEVDDDEPPGGGVFNYCLSISNGDCNAEPVQLDVSNFLNMIFDLTSNNFGIIRSSD